MDFSKILVPVGTIPLWAAVFNGNFGLAAPVGGNRVTALSYRVTPRDRSGQVLITTNTLKVVGETMRHRGGADRRRPRDTRSHAAPASARQAPSRRARRARTPLRRMLSVAARRVASRLRQRWFLSLSSSASHRQPATETAHRDRRTRGFCCLGTSRPGPCQRRRAAAAHRVGRPRRGQRPYKKRPRS